MIRIKGKNYIRIKDKLVEVDHLDKDGKPVLKMWSEEIRHPDGRVDCTVHVPYLQIQNKQELPSKE